MDLYTISKLNTLTKQRRRERQRKREEKFERQSFEEQLTELSAKNDERMKQKVIRDKLQTMKALQLIGANTDDIKSEIDKLLKR